MKKIEIGTMLTGNFLRKADGREELEWAMNQRHRNKIKVIAIEVVTQKEFDQLMEFPLADYDFIARHADDCNEVGNLWESLLVMTEDGDIALAVETEGYDYARYAALVRLPD